MDYDLKKNIDKNLNCEGIVLDSGDGEYIVKGYTFSGNKSNTTVMYWAANPPTYTTSFSGSGLPYPNPDIAFENTPNRGAVKTNDGSFEFRVRYPNSFYVGLGSKYVEPNVYIKICNGEKNNKIHTITLGHGIPFRMMTYPPTTPNVRPRNGPEFYAGRDKLPHRTQEQILRDSGYPTNNSMPDNFWNNVPPHE
tara:strand:+ start:6659 stop:7240 length:582 start_codon:yes stop_codon:yes gene_type:complete